MRIYFDENFSPHLVEGLRRIQEGRRSDWTESQSFRHPLTYDTFPHKYVFMRTTLDLPDPLFRELKTQSAIRGMKLKELVTELLQSGLTRQKAVVRPRSPLPVIRSASGRKHQALTNKELENLLSEEDAHGRD